MLVDVSTCYPGINTLYWSLGSILVNLKGKEGADCRMKYKLEIEQGVTSYECAIPTALSQIAIFESKYHDPTDYGSTPVIDYSFDLSKYCKATPSVKS
jgi:hypothetical protein